MDDVILPLLAAVAGVFVACMAMAAALAGARDRLLLRRESRRPPT